MRRLASILLFTVAIFSFAQKKNEKEEKFLQFSGVVLDKDSLSPIPFVSVYVNDKARTVTDYYGFFTVVASPGDLIKFTSITHKTLTYKISDTASMKYYYIIQVLVKDTIQLQTVEVYPWPTKEEFRRAFLNLDLSETDYDRADRNINQEVLTYIERNMVISGSEAYKNVMTSHYNKVYTLGQAPSINLLNPIAWANFIESWKKKNKTKEKTKIINRLNSDD
ncbi:MAG: carboxypeptidase-like regulatory domain-containing protein [Bacteroidia bacterium]|nr:carboxypeptidase-like regulatory domain-containing protein [Bacteroidia bacterium]